MPGVDGIRAFAVLAVIFYHAGFLWASGGYLGVESFFVVSGYLITSLLIGEFLARGEIGLLNFWLRRARRLLPALWLLLLGVLLITWVLAPDAWLRLKEDIWGALFYGTNWLYIFREIPYFERFGRPPLLQHLWSLGVEEQFYLFWPLILWFLCRALKVRAGRSKHLWIPILALIAASTTLSILLYHPDLDPGRVYYGTDTRAAGFLIGAALAVLFPPGARLPKADPFSWISFAFLLFLYVRLDEFSDLLFRGGFLLTSALTAIVMLSAAQPETPLGKFLGSGPLRWIGKRSYSIYLWHWPIMQVNRPGFECGLSTWGCLALNLALTLLLADLSYRLVENPIRRQGFKAYARNLSSRIPKPLLAGGVVALLVLVVISINGLQAQASTTQTSGNAALAGFDETRPPGPLTAEADSTLAVSAQPLTPTPGNTTLTAAASTLAATPLGELAPTTLDSAHPSTSLTPLPGLTATPASSVQVTLIGDSVMEGTLKYLEQSFDPAQTAIDTNRSRTIKDTPDILEALAAENKLAPVVVIHIGTNRPFDPGEFDDLMELLIDYGVQRAIFVNVKRPVPWEYTINKRISEGVERWPQAELVDWYAISKNYPGYFGDDQTHLTRTGAQAYVKAILEALDLPQ